MTTLDDIRALFNTDPHAADLLAWKTQLLVHSTVSDRTGVLVSIDDDGDADVWLGETNGEHLSMTAPLSNLVEVPEGGIEATG